MRKRVNEQSGMVTAEAAVVLPTLVLLLALAVGVVSTLGAQLKLVDAAREGVRVAARGESAEAVASVVKQAGPPGTTVQVRRTGRVIEVTTRAATKPLGLLPALHLGARAFGESEQR
jgi:hypothetical protein